MGKSLKLNVCYVYLQLLTPLRVHSTRATLEHNRKEYKIVIAVMLSRTRRRPSEQL